MQKRSFLVLVAATVLLVAAAVWSLTAGKVAEHPAAQGGPVFRGLAAQLGDLAWMRVVHGDMKADFNLIGDHWAVVEKGNYPAASGSVRKLLLGLAGLRLVEPKTERSELYPRLGLDDPSLGHSTSVSVQNRSGKVVAELLIGKSKPDWLGGGNDGVYIKKGGDKRTWLAAGSLNLPTDMAGWLDRRIVNVPQSRIDKVALTAPDGAVLVLKRDKPGGDFAVADPPPNAKFKDQAALAAPAGALDDLDLDDVTPRAELPVPDSGVSTAEFTTKAGVTIALSLFNHGKADWIAIGAAGAGDAAAPAKALNDKVAKWAYAIPAERAKLLRTRIADLLAKPKGS